MKSKQIMFFTIFKDIEQIFREVETDINVEYYKTGLLDSRDIPTYSSVFDIPNVGITFFGDWNRIENYLVMKKTTPLNIRDVPQNKGGVKFAVDQMINLKSIEIKIGGIYQEKENVIVAGRIATISQDQDSNELYKLFESKIKKEFKNIKGFYVSKEALEKLKSGWRLVTNEKLSKEYDLLYLTQ